MAGCDQAEGGTGGPMVPTEGLVLGNNMGYTDDGGVPWRIG